MRVVLLVMLASLPCAAQETRVLNYAPAPVDNPLKGLVPYAGKYDGRFPHSLEFNYLPLSALVVGPQTYDWKPLETLLDDIAGRGHQAIFRIYLEYPGKKDVIPAYLVKNGLKVHKYLYTETQPLPPAPIETPDYADPNLRTMLREFIAALGKKYDGDPRIGFITAGLLGTWGEWHTYPREELFASQEVQAEVMTAYEQAFKTTPILLRYPAGEKTWGKAPNAKRRFGYHDDSFAWATLHTGKPDDSWFYMTALREAGALEKWKSHPIGGEIRPEAWGKVFDETVKDKKIQNFRACVEATHATWLMDSGMFEKKQSETRRKRAEDEVRHMGYEFHIPSVTMTTQGETVTLKIEVQNRGVAPFYYDWRPVFGYLVDGNVVNEFRGQGTLIGLLPGQPNRAWTETFTKRDDAKIVMRVPNPLKNGHPLRFANAEQDRDRSGWLTLWK